MLRFSQNADETAREIPSGRASCRSRVGNLGGLGRALDFTMRLRFGGGSTYQGFDKIICGAPQGGYRFAGVSTIRAGAVFLAYCRSQSGIRASRNGPNQTVTYKPSGDYRLKQEFLVEVRAAARKRILYLPHALHRMTTKGEFITTRDVRDAVFKGTIIED